MTLYCMLYAPLTQTADRQGAVTSSTFTFSLPAVAKHLFIATQTCFLYIQDLDERINVLIFGVLLLCGGTFFSGVGRLALNNVGG